MKKYKTNKKAIVLLIVSIIVIAVLAIVAFFAVKNDKPSVDKPSVTSNDEEAIKKVIETYMKASAEWDYETAENCIDKESPQLEELLYDREENVRNIYEVHGYIMMYDRVGRLTSEDTEAIIESDKRLAAIEAEKLNVEFVNVVIEGDTASAEVKVKYSEADSQKLCDNGDLNKYMDDKYIKYCGMDMSKAFDVMPDEEFGNIRRRIEIEKNEEIIKNGYFITNELVTKINLKNLDGKWLIYDIT